MNRTVTWITDSKLECEPTSNVILCINSFTISASLTDKFISTCPDQIAYVFDYDDEDLPTGYLEDEGPLTDPAITGVICKTCLTDWVEETLDLTFQLDIEAGGNENIDSETELNVRGSGPLEFQGGDSIEVTLEEPNVIRFGLLVSTDTDNLAQLGGDGNIYVPIIPGHYDGWIPKTGDGWAYSSPNVLTIPAVGSDTYSIGDKIRLTQLGTVKYFFIQAIGSTTMTLTGGSDYTLSPDPVQESAFSKLMTPASFPSSFNFTPIYTGFSILPVGIHQFTMLGRRVFVDVQIVTPGTSNSVNYTIGLPVPNKTPGAKATSGGNQGYDNAVYQQNVFVELAAGASVADIKPLGASVAWTAGGQKAATFSLSYNA